MDEWKALVKTKWSRDDLYVRLKDATLACLYRDGIMIATCVLRPQAGNWWILETFVSKETRRGNGNLLVRSVMTWIYNTYGPFILSYTWELNALQLSWAWYRGWLKSMVAIQYGWVYKQQAVAKKTIIEPKWIDTSGGSACISLSGLDDGYAYVHRYERDPKWSDIAQTYGSLWMRSSQKPGSEWKWTGEFIVVGFLNCSKPDRKYDWITAEIASG
jgi:hypothetical protein